MAIITLTTDLGDKDIYQVATQRLHPEIAAVGKYC